MKRKELIRRVVESLKESGIKKSVHVPRHVLHISDDNGNSKDFTVKNADKEVAFSSADVGAILDAAIKVIIDALIRGDNVAIHGFGSLGLRYRKERASKQIGTNEDIILAGRYVPKFVFGNDLRMAARLYEMSMNDRLPDESWTTDLTYYDDLDLDDDQDEQELDEESDDKAEYSEIKLGD